MWNKTLIIVISSIFSKHISSFNHYPPFQFYRQICVANILDGTKFTIQIDEKISYMTWRLFNENIISESIYINKVW